MVYRGAGEEDRGEFFHTGFKSNTGIKKASILHPPSQASLMHSFAYECSEEPGRHSRPRLLQFMVLTQQMSSILTRNQAPVWCTGGLEKKIEESFSIQALGATRE